MQKPEFPKDIKLNLTRIIEFANLDMNDMKESILMMVNPNDITEAKNLHWQQADLYIKSVIELEGKNLTKESLNQIIKLVQTASTTHISIIGSSSLLSIGYDY